MIRKARLEDKDVIMSIVVDAQEYLRELDIDQWQDGYPTPASIEDDIVKGVGYVVIGEGEIVGYAAIILSGEPTYQQIADKWMYGDSYVVIHRLCTSSSHRREGIAMQLMSHAATLARSEGFRAFRIDTHEGNIRMLAMLKKLCFSYAGIINYDSGKRVAYELDLRLSKKI